MEGVVGNVLTLLALMGFFFHHLKRFESFVGETS